MPYGKGTYGSKRGRPVMSGKKASYVKNSSGPIKDPAKSIAAQQKKEDDERNKKIAAAQKAGEKPIYSKPPKAPIQGKTPAARKPVVSKKTTARKAPTRRTTSRRK